MKRLALLFCTVCIVRAESITGMIERVSVLRQKLDAVVSDSVTLRAALETSEYIIAAAQGKAPGLKAKPVYRRAKNGKYYRVPSVRLDTTKDIPFAETLIDGLERGDDPLLTRTGDMRQAYRSSVDGTLQPYRIFVPIDFDRNKEYPLALVLHGHSGDENTYMDRYVSRANNGKVLQSIAQQRGYIVVAPRGRGPGQVYIGPSETDVLEVLDRVKALYPIKNDEVFLTGHSSGGMGTWRIGLKFPERWAGLASVGSAFAMQPYEILRKLDETNSDKPLLYCQGRRDRLATQRGAKNLVDNLTPKMPNFRYKEWPDGHDSLGVSSMKTVFDFFDAVRFGQDLIASDAVSKPVYAPAKRRTRTTAKPGAGTRPAAAAVKKAG